MHYRPECADRLQRRMFSRLVLVALTVFPACQSRQQPSAPAPFGERVVLSIDRTGALMLDGKAIARPALAAELARLRPHAPPRAGVVENEAREAPALAPVIVCQPDDATPFSTIHELLLVCQEQGFSRYRFETLVPNDSSTQHPSAPIDIIVRLLNSVRPRAVPETADPRKEDESELPSGLRTIPLVLWADERGQIGRAELGEHEFQDELALRAELDAILHDPDVSFDRAVLRVAPALRYGAFARVARQLSDSRIKSFYFAILSPGE